MRIPMRWLQRLTLLVVAQAAIGGLAAQKLSLKDSLVPAGLISFTIRRICSFGRFCRENTRRFPGRCLFFVQAEKQLGIRGLRQFPVQRNGFTTQVHGEFKSHH